MLRQIPPLVLIAALSPLLPVLALLWRGTGSAARRWLLMACLLSLCIDGAMLSLMLNGINNHWVAYLFTPIFGAALILCLAEWQESDISRTAIQLTAVLLLVAAAILTLTVEDTSRFSRFASPLRQLLVLSVAVWTLVRTLPSEMGERFWRAERLWVPLGVTIYSAVSAAYFPLAAYLQRAEPALVSPVLQAKSALVVLAFLLIGWGAWWKTPEHSGPSSLS